MNYRIGLDIGIGSVGYAVLETDLKGEPVRIVRIGSRVFDALEHPKDGSSLAMPRRVARGMRRRLRRRVHRLERAKACIARHLDVQPKTGYDVNRLRAVALDEVVTNSQLAAILCQIIKRRGYKSNRKSETVSNKSDAGKLLTATTANAQYRVEKGYRTVGEMYYKDAKYSHDIINSNGELVTIYNTRNKKDSYDLCILRSELESEIRLILDAQAQLGNSKITQQFTEEILTIFNSQRSFDEGPGKPSPYTGTFAVGNCTFEPQQERAPVASYTAEYSKCLQVLNSIVIKGDTGSSVISSSDRANIMQDIVTREKLTYAQLRKKLKLTDDQHFNMLTYGQADASKTENKIAFSMKNSYAIRRALSEENAKDIQLLDCLSVVLSKNKSDNKIRTEIANHAQLSKLDNAEIEALLSLSFAKFGHLSLVALHKIQPYLEQCYKYSEACQCAGYNHTGHEVTDKLALLSGDDVNSLINDIGVPVVKRAVSQTFKVINAIIRQYGQPLAINVELARELSKTHDERKKIDKSNLERKADNDKIYNFIKSQFNIVPHGQDIVKYRLYQEQGAKCAYSQQPLDLSRLFEAGYAEIDHILPYSRSCNDSYNNKVLVLSSENQAKRDRIPAEYLQDNAQRWQQFQSFVMATYKGNRVKREYLLKEKFDQQDQQEFKSRNLNDTKYISRFVYNTINDYLQFADSQYLNRRVMAVNGATTSYLRKMWGINKVRSDGDMHHAVDAVVIACATQGMVQKISVFNRIKETYIYNRTEDKYIHRATGEVLSDTDILEQLGVKSQPYYGFGIELSAHLSPDPHSHIDQLLSLGYEPDQVMAVKTPFVSRMPRRKVTGAIHEATIRSAKHIDEGIVVTKKPITALKLDKDGEIKDYYNKQSDLLLYNALRQALINNGGDANKAFGQGFFKPKSDGTAGNKVRSVKVADKATIGMRLDKTDAYADNGSMVRIDIFSNKGKYFVVPVYTKDVYAGILPNKAIAAAKPYERWTDMTLEYKFLFTLYPNDLIYVEHRSGFELTKTDESKHKIMCNKAYLYYVSANSCGGAIKARNHDNSYAIKSLGAKTLQHMSKYSVDVLGNVYPVGTEIRQPLWRMTD